MTKYVGGILYICLCLSTKLQNNYLYCALYGYRNIVYTVILPDFPLCHKGRVSGGYVIDTSPIDRINTCIVFVLSPKIFVVDIKVTVLHF